MTSIPLLAFSTDSKKNLDTAIKFMVAAALPSASVAAQPSHVPPVPVQPTTRGLAIPLLPAFKHESMATANGNWRSKFDVIVPVNPRLETMLGNTLEAITGHGGTIAVPYIKADGITLTPIAGVTTLEALIYYLATTNSDVQITKVNIAGSVYYRLMADYTFVPVGPGGGGNE